MSAGTPAAPGWGLVSSGFPKMNPAPLLCWARSIRLSVRRSRWSQFKCLETTTRPHLRAPKVTLSSMCASRSCSDIDRASHGHLSFICDRCANGIEPNKKRIREHLGNCLMLVTALNVHIGYEKSCEDLPDRVRRRRYFNWRRTGG